MAEFLTAQLDYVYFVYGLALVLLGAVASTTSRAEPGCLPWGWLGGFAFVHGLVEWLHLAEMVGGDLPSLRLGVDLLLLLSYLVLAEFARRATAVVRGRGPGPWVTLLLGALPLLAVIVRDPAALNGATRVFVALPAGLWTAAVLGRAAQRSASEGKEAHGPLGWAAAWMAVYAIAAGVVVTASPDVPAGWPTADAFLRLTGVPVAVLRGSAIGAAALGIWAHAATLDGQGRVIAKRWRFFWLAAATLLLVLAGGWVFTSYLGRQHDLEVEDDARAVAAQVQDHMLMEMEASREAVRTTAGLVERFRLQGDLRSGGSPRLDDVVDAIAGPGEEHVVYLLDDTGKTVASSNRGRGDSFLEKRYDMRPYFHDAMAGRPGGFVGRGVTSGKPGYYASWPLRDAAGRVVGVAVVKHVLSSESFGPLGTANSFLVGADGTVLVGAEPGHEGQPMWSRPRSVDAPVEDRTAPVLPAPFSGSTWVRLDGMRHVAVRVPLPGLDWSVVSLRHETTRGASRLLGILVTLLLSLAIVAAFVLLQRQLGTESRIARKRQEAEGRAREAARRADTDALTGIPNRQAFNEAMAREVARARRFRQPLAMVIVDLDHFKRVNDQYGHPVGDQVLVGAARMLSTRVRESDLVARWGGEEFAVITTMTDAAGAARLAEKLRALLEVTHLGPVGAMTASFGVAELHSDDTVESLVRRADEALYAAKTGGRNRVCCAEGWVDMEVVVAAEVQGKAGAGPDGKPIYMETGYGPIDAEHADVSASLAAFVELVDTADLDSVRQSMPRLVAAVSDHFSHEEALMRRHAYPARARHEEAHMLFVADAKRFHAELERNGVTSEFCLWASSRLPEWFRYHILAHDVALGKFLLGIAGGSRAPARRTERIDA